MDPIEIPPLIVIVEDTPEIGSLVAELLELEFGARTIHVPDGSRALEVLKGVQPALLILDYQLPGFSGLEIYDWLRAQPTHAGVPVLWMTAAPNDPTFRGRNPHPVISKPFHLEDLVQAVQTALAGRTPPDSTPPR